MTLPGFTAPGAAWLFTLLVPLVVFYFLKLKRPRLTIPSLVLWRQVMNDNRVNSPFQKFKRNLLLLLQLLLLLLLVLAAMQPFLRKNASRAVRLPVLIDNSASMAALDKAGGLSRLAASKKRVREMIDTLPGNEELCLISFAKTARKRSSFTNDRRVLREALDAIEIEDVPGDIEDALRLAQALARTAPFDGVLVLSDGNFPAQANFELSFKLNYQRLAPSGPNFGITSCNARRALGGKWDVFVQIEGSADAEGGGTVEVMLDGNRVASERFTLSKGGSQRMTFSIDGERASVLQARLIPDGFDSLASDNLAWLELPAARPLIVFTPASMGAYRHALESISGVRVSEDTIATHDLVITDRVEDLGIKARMICTVGIVPPELQKLVSIAQQPATPVDWRRDSPLLQHVEFADVIAMDDPRSREGVSTNAFTNAGFDILVHGPHGPMILEKREGEKLSVFLLFHTDRSTLPYRVGFPVFVTNLVQAAMKQARIAEADSNRTGVLPPVTLQPDRDFEIIAPDGTRRREKSDANGVLSGIPAPRTGLYAVLENGTPKARIGASLLSPAETTLKTVEQIQFNDQLKVSASAVPLKTDRSLWYPLACAAFGLLLLEWWFFQRKPGGLAR